jgi:hypothetical protein
MAHVQHIASTNSDKKDAGIGCPGILDPVDPLVNAQLSFCMELETVTKQDKPLGCLV